MDQNFKNSVMIALLPMTTDWAKVALPHLTLVYAGPLEDLKPTDFNEMAKEASMLAMTHRPLQLRVKAFEIFGQEPERVEVLTLYPTPELMQMRQRVVSWNVSNFSFNPHVTVGPVGTMFQNLQPIDLMRVPPAIAFDRIMVMWGEEQLTFWLRP